jgi:hypothetical protein
MKVFLKAWLTSSAVMIPLTLAILYLPKLCCPDSEEIVFVHDSSTQYNELIAWVDHEGHVHGDWSGADPDILIESVPCHCGANIEFRVADIDIRSIHIMKKCDSCGLEYTYNGSF